MVRRFLNEYGIVLVLAVLCIVFSVATWAEQRPRGAAAGRQVAQRVLSAVGAHEPVVVVAGVGEEERQFAETVAEALRRGGRQPLGVLSGGPPEVRQGLIELLAAGRPPQVVACSSSAAQWTLWDNLASSDAPLAALRIVAPQSYWWPNFLKTENLLNIANQIAVIAIIAAGMTLVIITGGIDLSVGSLVALSAVLAALWIRDWAGAETASASGMVVCCLAAMLTCGAVGMGTGFLVTMFRRPPQIPPFIVTLAVMLAASGAAYLVSNGQSINQVPASFIWLGRGADLFGVPNAVVLTGLIYAGTHLLMTRTTLGRYIYAVGGNPEAARLSGVPVRRVLIFVYAWCGFLAGLGGIVLASQLKSGAPTYGQMYELYVIAAVVVGGTSLSGGQGHVLGTLAGALVIAVIQNGMNLVGLESYTQKIVLGTIILAAVVIDRLRRLPG
ncbi:MAG: hypothetical protein KatS3mg110_3339 [Pirellulaceae bacterium]|nr:MAG: hypothetical protein KatS3mg110_3339 [Pirellulaceae bacterium]